MLATYKPRDVIQFLSGPKRGLLAQIALIDGALKCLARDMDGTPHIFDMAETDDARLVGTAFLGPKSDGVAPPAETPPAIEPLTENEITGLLEPLPTDVKPQPLAAADDAALKFSKEDEERLVTSAYAPYRATRRKRAKKPKVKKPKPEKAVRPPIGPLWTVVVRNGMGEEATVTIPVREGSNPANLTGAVINIACKKKEGKTIAFIRPFTVSDWTRVVKAEEAKTEEPTV